MRSPRPDPAPVAEPWLDLARAQAMVISRRQLVGLEGGPARARRNLRAGRWQTLEPGIYATFTGPVPFLTRVWGHLLAAGEGAAVGGRSALYLAGVVTEAPDVVEICVPHGRRIPSMPGRLVTQRRGLPRLVHPARTPPQVRVEEVVLDVAARARSPEVVVDVVLAAVQRRVTTPPRLRAALERRSRCTWRGLVADLLQDAAEGMHSPLERRYHLDVESAHGLPRAERNVAARAPGRTVEYPDARYRRFRVRVELDGAYAHPDRLAFRDRARDNRAAVDGDLTLRYGWREVTGDPCGVASQVAAVLRGRGWAGSPRRCGHDCTLR